MIGCSVDGCDRKVLAKGYCDAHYRRYLRSKERPGSSRPIDDPLRKYEPVDPARSEEKVTTRVSYETAQTLKQAAAERGVGVYTQVRDVIEDWSKGKLIYADSES